MAPTPPPVPPPPRAARHLDHRRRRSRPPIRPHPDRVTASPDRRAIHLRRRRPPGTAPSALTPGPASTVSQSLDHQASTDRRWPNQRSQADDTTRRPVLHATGLLRTRPLI